MGDARVSDDSPPPARRLHAGIISKIRMENFMCHSNLEIELGEFINFITGQNGSGKSAILTALRVAFGCRAKATERANALKDFIKIGCSHALVHVELKNQGDDAFKHEVYGDVIIIERRISESSSTITLKNCSGKKIANGKEELVKIVEHFNIDVENPCVIMSQDKSREFLNSGNSKDKFRFYFKATLLEHLSDLILDIGNRLNQATEFVSGMEKSLSPLVREIEGIESRIRNIEQIEEIALEVQELRKKLAWAWVYDVDQELQKEARLIEKMKGRIPACQDRIDKQMHKMKELRDEIRDRKAKIEDMMVRTADARRTKAELQQEMQKSIKEKVQVEGDCERQRNNIQNLVKRVRALEQQIQDMQELEMKDTQAEECEMEQKMREIQNEIDQLYVMYQSLKEEEESMLEKISVVENELKAIAIQIENDGKMHTEIQAEIRYLEQQQTDRLTAFGGQKVVRLLKVIEQRRHKFQRQPIGPIGMHLSLVSGDTWATAIEYAIGGVLNSFIVTNHQDFQLLKACAKEVDQGLHRDLKIVIYDFSRPRLNVPRNMLPQTDHPTVLSMLHSDNPTVMNVLIDTASAERIVLMEDRLTGAALVFKKNISNLKEVVTSDGFKIFSRGNGQTSLPLNKNQRGARLGSSENQIKDLERDALHAKEQLQDGQGKKRKLNESLHPLQEKLNSAKRRRQDVERQMRSKELELQDVQMLAATIVSSAASTSTVDELHREMSKLQEEIQEKEIFVQKVQITLKEVEDKANNLKSSFKNLCDSAKADIDSLETEERELMEIESQYQDAEQEKMHFENVMSTKVVSVLKEAEDTYHELEQKREVNYGKASLICPEAEIKSLGDWCGSSPEQLSAKLIKLKERLKRERGSCSDSIDDLKQLHEKKKRKIMKKQQMYQAFKENLDACKGALTLRQIKFQRNATLAKRELTWKFNSHLGKKGISGKVVLSYEEKTLSIEVTMPQDGSNKSVSDTRGLSGGERSFSTLCFALALHEMTEAPFRAMDEFDVFMDAISRKISLDTLVDFALSHGSQWIFITPHDISIVKQDRRIKKQQMAAPRS